MREKTDDRAPAAIKNPERKKHCKRYTGMRRVIQLSRHRREEREGGKPKKKTGKARVRFSRVCSSHKNGPGEA